MLPTGPMDTQKKTVRDLLTISQGLDVARGDGIGGDALPGVCLCAWAGGGGSLLRPCDGGHPAAVHVPGAVCDILQGGLPPYAPRVVASVGERLQPAAGGYRDGRHPAVAAGGSGFITHHFSLITDPARGPADVHHRPLCHGGCRGDTETGRLAGRDDHLYLSVEFRHGAARTPLFPDD